MKKREEDSKVFNLCMRKSYERIISVVTFDNTEKYLDNDGSIQCASRR